MQTIKIAYHDTKFGKMILGEFDGKICLCDWMDNSTRNGTDNRLQRLLKAKFKVEQTPLHDKLIDELREYFAGKRQKFDVPTEMVGTDFQKNVWNETCKIGYGETVTYHTIAERLGMPQNYRSIAASCGTSSLAIIIPCHRVIGIHELEQEENSVKKSLIEMEKGEE